MAFEAKLIVNGKTFIVEGYDYSGTQRTDATGKPSSRPQQGNIDLTVHAKKDEMIFHWFKNPELMYDGKVVFKDSGLSSPMRVTTFKKGFCVRYRERYRSQGSDFMTIEFSISPGYIDINGIDDEKQWG